MCVLNHRASVLASPDSRVQIGFIQKVRRRDGENDKWFQLARDLLYQKQLAFLVSLLEPYANGVPMRAGPPFSPTGGGHVAAATPYVLVVPRVGVVLCDILGRRSITGTTASHCSSCNATVMVSPAPEDIGDEEHAALMHGYHGRVCHCVAAVANCGCG
jgi:hypothetical protein